MESLSQEILALLIVALAVLFVVHRIYRAFLAESLAKWLLKRGRVKWAMRIYPRFHRPSKSSGDCCE